MDIEKPPERISLCFCPGIPERQVDKERKSKKCNNNIKLVGKFHGIEQYRMEKREVKSSLDKKRAILYHGIYEKIQSFQELHLTNGYCLSFFLRGDTDNAGAVRIR
jgi:hypothetical protein